MKQQLFSDWRLFLALGGGSGLVPKAPGTAATALAWGLYNLIVHLPGVSFSLLAAGTLLMILLGAPLCSYAERVLQVQDDGRIVWDEIAAFFLVLLATPLLWQWQLAAFVLFRILDAAKPFPIGWFDRRVKGGFGIMLDDLVAALLTVLILSVFYWQVAIG